MAGWTVEREPYIAMEAREVTVMKERMVPAIEYTTHTAWRSVSRPRLQPIAARRKLDEQHGAQEEQKEGQKEQLLTAQPSTGVEEQHSVNVEQEGVLIAELGMRVTAVRGRHDSSAGLLVCSVSEDGAGSKSCILAGDVVMSVNSSEVRSVDQLRARIEGSSTGPMLLRVMRHGRRHLTLIADAQRKSNV